MVQLRQIGKSSEVPFLVADAKALWGADFMANHTMEGIQCVILMMVFMVSPDLDLDRLS